MKDGFFLCYIPDCTCWFTSRSALIQHIKREHDKVVILV
jgi:hypothetical protein